MTPLDPKDRLPDSALALPAVTENGGRVELRLVPAQTNDTRCVYSARWFVGPRMVTGSVMIAAPAPGTKLPHITLEAGDLPAWLGSFTTQLIKLTCRSVLADQPDFSKVAWPRRLTRWRRASDE